MESGGGVFPSVALASAVMNELIILDFSYSYTKRNLPRPNLWNNFSHIYQIIPDDFIPFNFYRHKAEFAQILLFYQ